MALRCTWENLGVPTTSLGAHWITVELSGKNIIFFGNASGVPGNHSYYLLFNDFQNLCIQCVFPSIHVCIDIATHLHTVYLDCLHVLVATVPDPQFGSGSGVEPNWNRCNGFYRIKKLNRTEPIVLWPVPQFCQVLSLAAIKYLSSDHITIWYIRKRCSSACSFTSSSPLCYLINIRWVGMKYCRNLAVYRCDTTNIDWIAQWTIGGERACKSAYFTYISYCDMITNQIPIWSQSSEFAQMRLCSMYNPANKPRVNVQSG